jgi:hypothetical protein
MLIPRNLEQIQAESHRTKELMTIRNNPKVTAMHLQDRSVRSGQDSTG